MTDAMRSWFKDNQMLVLFTLIMLTALDGSPIWVESAHVQIIRPATAQCQAQNGSGVQVGSVAVCVRETPEEIQEKLRRAK